jgi:hypothetical protein
MKFRILADPDLDPDPQHWYLEYSTGLNQVIVINNAMTYQYSTGYQE